MLSVQQYLVSSGEQEEGSQEQEKTSGADKGEVTGNVGARGALIVGTSQAFDTPIASVTC